MAAPIARSDSERQRPNADRGSSAYPGRLSHPSGGLGRSWRSGRGLGVVDGDRVVLRDVNNLRISRRDEIRQTFECLTL